MLQGLRTVICKVTDLEAAKHWYSKLLNQEPYFDQSYYVGYNVGEGSKVACITDPFGNEIGLIENPHFK